MKTARMNRLGSELLAGVPLESIDEVIARIDAVLGPLPWVRLLLTLISSVKF